MRTLKYGREPFLILFYALFYSFSMSDAAAKSKNKKVSGCFRRIVAGQTGVLKNGKIIFFTHLFFKCFCTIRNQLRACNFATLGNSKTGKMRRCTIGLPGKYSPVKMWVDAAHPLPCGQRGKLNFQSTFVVLWD